MKATACLKKIEEGIIQLRTVKKVVNILYVSIVVTFFLGMTTLMIYPHRVIGYVMLSILIVAIAFRVFFHYYALQIKREANIAIPKERRIHVRTIIERWWSRQRNRLLASKTQEAKNIAKEYMDAKTLVESSDSEFA